MSKTSILGLQPRDKSAMAGVKTINNYRTRLSEISWFVSGELNNCFIIRSTNLFFNEYPRLPFSRKSNHKKEKRVVSFTHEQNIICSQTLKPNTSLTLTKLNSWTTLRTSRPLVLGRKQTFYDWLITRHRKNLLKRQKLSKILGIKYTSTEKELSKQDLMEMINSNC